MGTPRLSFEFFPPKTPEAEGSLEQTVNRLKLLSLEFVSVAFGADGSTRRHTYQAIRDILTKTTPRHFPHLTCVGAPQNDIVAIVADYWSMGVRQIIALRGDPQGPRNPITFLIIKAFGRISVMGT